MLYPLDYHDTEVMASSVFLVVRLGKSSFKSTMKSCEQVLTSITVVAALLSVLTCYY